MKFADIAKRAKQTRIACVLTDENGVQWVDVGAAVYRLEGLPKMDSEDFLRLAGVSEEKIGSFYVEGNNIPETSLRNETGEEIALTSDMAGLVVDMDGYRLMPFYTALHGVIWLDVRNMEPIMKGDTNYLRFFLRRFGNGWMIAVKDGLVLIAIIPEKKMSEFLYEQVQILWMRCEQRGVEKEKKEWEEGRNMKYQVCESCGAHLDHGEKCDCQNEE
ncbi:hypothetical protein [Anaerotignum faecicola]